MTNILLMLTLAVIAAVVLVLVVYLLGVIIALWKTIRNLSNLAGGLIAIRDQTDPLPEHLSAVNGGLVELLNRLLAVNGNLAAIVSVAKRQ
ncbi:MAG: hypothetical protein HOB79_01275 [Rhodospirillaceae bacterium]|jgi:hypothetical protein|nr:hypothetical protein [Rhodospirillaceae bacterium]MBT7769784.1 hypothetical protein [Rhodospirillales bacterium]MBT4699679.1 hypothetical protein [Rhodospirillaceae bacterium]MBT5034434.1 hypothetical protein [Rhodospirillaceae bacterium]MBT6218400.1 hypothetical protein [Rhodospirillaceae bacterium]